MNKNTRCPNCKSKKVKELRYIFQCKSCKHTWSKQEEKELRKVSVTMSWKLNRFPYKYKK